VVSAEMYDTCQLYYDVDVAIAAAAVADYKPKNVANHKIKKK
jgi:phosphopantothenoylcysteine decarboxylase/phosphopantothenate--cysteine ligase